MGKHSIHIIYKLFHKLTFYIYILLTCRHEAGTTVCTHEGCASRQCASAAPSGVHAQPSTPGEHAGAFVRASHAAGASHAEKAHPGEAAQNAWLACMAPAVQAVGVPAQSICEKSND